MQPRSLLNMTRDQYTRRGAITSTTAALSMTAVAGCSSSERDEGTPTPTPEPENQLRGEIRAAYDESGAWVDEAGGAEINEAESGFEIYTGYWYNYISGDGPQTVQERVQYTARDVLEAVFTTGLDVGYCGVTAFVETVDEYGEEGESGFSAIGLDVETADRINWENFRADNLPNVAETYSFDSSYFR